MGKYYTHYNFRGTNIGANNETWLNGNANYVTGGPYTAMRCGALATATSNRTQSGASFYGVMEMSGNASELTVCANNNGTAFTGNHGDGVLDAQSNANVPGWPSLTNDLSIIIRGGHLHLFMLIYRYAIAVQA